MGPIANAGLLAATLACAAGCERAGPQEANAAGPASVLPPAARTADAASVPFATTPPLAKRTLVSGHSLTDQPLPDQLAAIAKSLGSTLDWDRQYAWGSTLRERSVGRAGDLSGYRFGVDRRGDATDVLRELRTAGASATPYDTLIVAEIHSLLGALVWDDSLRMLRHYHERFIEANPRGQTWLFESWWNVSDASDPRRWIAYEREASKVWHCMAARVNLSLEAQGRPDRIASLPVAAALAYLVERATQGAGVAGLGDVAADGAAAVVNRLFADDVHLRPLGSYYIALVTYAVVFDRSPVGAWAPTEATNEQASSLQNVAHDFVAEHRRSHTELGMAQCRDLLQRSFIGRYTAYHRDTAARRELGTARAYWRWARHSAEFQWRLRLEDSRNPFYFDAATDAAYWLPEAPR